MQLWQKILIGMGLGIIAGVFLGEDTEYLKPLGTLFLQLIKMLVVPLVFFSLISGITSLKDPSSLGRIGVKAIVVYMATTVLAITIGLSAGNVFKPGVGAEINLGLKIENVEAPTLVDIVSNIVPENLFEALSGGNILQVIFFAVLFGISASLLGKRAEPFIKLNHSMADIMYKMTNIIMLYAPIGVFGLMAWVAGTNGIGVLKPMMLLVMTFLVGAIIHVVIIYGFGAYLLTRLSGMQFFKNILNAQVVAFSTSSSSATLPVTIKTAREKLGVSESTSGFILPLGSTINMDGTALYQGIVVTFVAQAIGIDLALGDIIMVILTATLASIGAAGIPGAGLIMLSMILSSIGLPLEAIAIIAGIDRILDMIRTAINVTGDLFVATYIDKSEGTLDEKIYSNE